VQHLDVEDFYVQWLSFVVRHEIDRLQLEYLKYRLCNWDYPKCRVVLVVRIRILNVQLYRLYNLNFLIRLNE